jgi:hypothetical protein
MAHSFRAPIPVELTVIHIAMKSKAKHATQQKVNLREIFLGLQKQMLEELATAKKVLKHPVAKGDAGELRWLSMLQEYLPERYCATKAFIIDSRGVLSQQIDVVIYDRHYSPFLFNQGGTKYVPAESVYAVFEVRPILSIANIRYAAAKAASVRILHRTSAPIPHAGGIFDAKTLHPIIGGLLTTTQTSADRNVQDELRSLATEPGRVDLVCALAQGTYNLSSTSKKASVQQRSGDSALIAFFFALLERLQAAGTVPALDINAYAKNL